MEEKTIEPEQSKYNGKEIKITGEFCGRWGLSSVISRFKSIFIKTLVDKGYKVTYKIIPIQPGQEEYYVYVDDKDNNKQILFSNNKKIHKDAILGYEIYQDNIKEVVEKVEEMIK